MIGTVVGRLVGIYGDSICVDVGVSDVISLTAEGPISLDTGVLTSMALLFGF